MKPWLIAVAVCAMSVFTVSAFSHDDPNEPKRYITTGEVQQIDMKTQTITLKHDPLKNLGLPAATKTFPVKDPAMLKKVKPGDKVLFSARNINGKVMIRTLELPDEHQAAHSH